jgi:hypothetical protein
MRSSTKMSREPAAKLKMIEWQNLAAGAHSACPSCGSTRVAEILYGELNVQALRPYCDTGRIILRGCCFSHDSPQWHCQDCGREWGRAGILDWFQKAEEAAARSRSVTQRLLTRIGMSGEEPTLLNGMVRRLTWATPGVAAVLMLGHFGARWAAWVVLTIWFLPLLLHAALLEFAGCLFILLGSCAGTGFFIRREMIVVLAITMLEPLVVIGILILLGGSLL